MSSSLLPLSVPSSTPPPLPPSSLNDSPSTPSLPPETTKFLYSTLHRVDNLVRRYHTLRSESNSQANLLSHLSTRLSLLAHSTLGPSVQTIDYNHILCPPVQRLSLADRMAISLKDNLDRCMVEIDSSLTEMELLYMNVDDTLVTLCKLVNSLGAGNIELVRGAKHVQQVYLTLATEVQARRDLWYRFTADEKRKSLISASTVGDILLTPLVEWEAFAKEWVAIGAEEGKKDEVDDLAIAMGNWTSQEKDEEMMQ